MAIFFWYWWIIIPALLPLMLISKLVLPAVCVCVFMGSVVRVVPNMSAPVQVVLAITLFIAVRLLIRFGAVRHPVASEQYIGLRFTINEHMLRYKMAQIDKQKVPLSNVKQFAVGERVRVAGVQQGRLLLKQEHSIV